MIAPRNKVRVMRIPLSMRDLQAEINEGCESNERVIGFCVEGAYWVVLLVKT
jgi:hypothetical protein